MVDVRKRRIYKKILYSKATLLILFVVLVFTARATWNVYGHVKVTRQNLERVEANLAELESRKAFLVEESETLSSEAGLEDAIRGRLPVAKEGERVIIIVEDKNFVEEEEEEAEELRWWQRWWQNLFSR